MYGQLQDELKALKCMWRMLVEKIARNWYRVAS